MINSQKPSSVSSCSPPPSTGFSLRFEDTPYSIDSIAEAISHELGHTFGLSHDGTTAPVEEYYTGHGNWPHSWGPIMGASYGRTLVQWSKGEYASADNRELDIEIIAGNTGVGHAPDEAGNSRATATALTITRSIFSQTGVISSPDDEDWYSFTTAAASFFFQSLSAESSPNLDQLVELYDASGTLQATLDSADEVGANLEANLAAGTYYVRVRGTGRGDPLGTGYSKYGSIGRYTLSATFGPTATPPVISAHPASATLTADPNGSLYLSVTASGAGTLRYAWQKDGVPLPDNSRFYNIKSSSLSGRSVTFADAGQYRAVVTNFAGSTQSTIATITVVAPPPPSITYHPRSENLYVGETFNASAYVSSIGATTYQWIKDGTDLAPSTRLSGTTSDSLTLRSLIETDAGVYRLRVTNASGSTLSNPATLTVTMPAPPLVIIQPVSTTVYIGASSFGFSTLARGNGVFTYRWEKDGVPLSDGGNIRNSGSNNLRINNPALADAGRYRLKITNAGGSVYTNEAIITVAMPQPPVFTTHPQNRTAYIGESSTSFSAQLADSTVQNTYQWQKDGVNISNSTKYSLSSNYLTIYTPIATDAGQYTVTATNAGGTTTSNPATLTISPPPLPVIATTLSPQTVIQSQSFSWYVSVSSPVAYTVQWYKDGAPLPGYTSAYFTKYDSLVSDSGKYKIAVTNSSGTTTSNEATVTVTAAVKPVFTTQPAGVRIYEGGSTAFTATVKSSPEPTYQWHKNGVLFSSGGYSPTLTLNNVTLNDAATYTLTATNAAGSTTASPATLTVLTRASGDPLDLSPVSKTVGPGRVTYSLRIRTASPWTVVNDTPWLAVSKNSGTYDDLLEITVAPNPHAASRTATLAIGGLRHTLTQQAAGTPVRELWSVGRNYYGALGDHAILEPTYPARVADNIQAVFGGYNYTLLLDKTGTLTSLGSAADFTFPSSVTGVRTAAAGANHALYLKTDGTLWGLGNNTFRQLSDDTTNYRIAAPVLVASQVKAVAAAQDHTLYVTDDGKLWSRGRNFNGQLGTGNTDTVTTATHVASEVSTLVASGNLTVFLKTDGTAWGMGSNSYSPLGTSYVTGRPIQILAGVAAIAVGDNHALFLKIDSTLWASGYNAYGQLGDGTTASRSTPVQVATGVKAIAAGNNRSFFIKADDSLWTMGSNESYALGIGTSPQQSTPVQVAQSVKAIVARNGRTFFIRSDDSLWAAGYNYNGELGPTNAPAQRKRTRPIHVASNVAAASAGYAHSLYLTQDGRAWGTGANTYQSMGVSSGANAWSAPSLLMSDVQSLSAAYALSLLVKRDNTLWYAGELYPRSSASFAKIANNVASAEAGRGYLGYIKTDASLWTQGQNFTGQLGQTSTTYSTPDAAQAATGAVTLAPADYHTLFLDTAGGVHGTGHNATRQLANADGLNRTTPILIASGATAIASGNAHSLWIKTDKTLWGVGSNNSGELATGTSASYLATPGQIATDARSVTAGNGTTYYTTTDKTLWALGRNDFGQLGDGTTTNRPTPVKIAANVETLSAGDEHLLFIASGDIRLDATPPAITAFSPATGAPGQSVTISGTHLTGVTEVLFSGIPASAISTDTTGAQITATVPSHHTFTPGPITVATFNGIAQTSAYFTPAWSPRIERQPSAQTVTNGRDIAFTADATGSPAVSFQWQTSTDNGATWTNIANGGIYGGAATRELSLIGVTSSTNGHRFRYLASNTLGTLTSDSFTLTIAPIQFPRPTSLAFDPAGNLYIADGSLHTIQKVNTTAQLGTFAGTAEASGATDATGTAARFNEPKGVTFGGSNLYVADTSNSLIRVINATTAAVTTLAGSRDNRTHKDGTGTAAWFAAPLGLAQDTSGNLYVADSTSHTIRKITSTGVVTTLAGAAGVSGSNDGPGVAARFNEPSDVALGADGNLYVADALNHAIRRITLTPTIQVSTLAGLPETPGDLDGLGFDAAFRTPRGLTSDAVGNLYVADTGNSTIRKITTGGTSAGLVTTVAGDSMLEGNRDAIGSEAWFRQPADLALDATGTLYITDTGNSAIRKINLNTRAVTTATFTSSTTPENPNPGTGGPPSPPPPSSGGGGGGGGGAPSIWFLGALLLIALERLRRDNR